MKEAFEETKEVHVFSQRKPKAKSRMEIPETQNKDKLK